MADDRGAVAHTGLICVAAAAKRPHSALTPYR